MNQYVLDASAVLALLNQEPGADQVEALLAESCVSAVNAAEVLTRPINAGMPDAEALESFNLLGLEVADFNLQLAAQAAALRRPTKKKGLSLEDLCYLGLGLAMGYEVVTAEREWEKLNLCPILLIR